MRWDVFCKVIDNHGDVGVCWRLAQQLAARGQTVRLWIDDPSMLAWMAPQGSPGVEVIPWTTGTSFQAPGDVVIEAFGCELAPSFVAAMAAAAYDRRSQPVWINLEYLSAEAFVDRCHGLPSPVLSGPGAGLVKHFFYPGFTPATGGLLREPDLLERQAGFDCRAWLAGHGVRAGGDRLVSLFCYEPAPLAAWLQQLCRDNTRTHLLVTAGRAEAAVRTALPALPAGVPGALSISYLPLLTQQDYDHLLWACDLNFVRGEDSWLRALWAGKPFVWQAYPQEDGAHHAKLEAFLHRINAPPPVCQFHAAWNGAPGVQLATMQAIEDPIWAEAARAGLLAQPGLVTRLLAFAYARVGGSPGAG